jgi:hypothetical protein
MFKIDHVKISKYFLFYFFIFHFFLPLKKCLASDSENKLLKHLMDKKQPITITKENLEAFKKKLPKDYPYFTNRYSDLIMLRTFENKSKVFNACEDSMASTWNVSSQKLYNNKENNKCYTNRFFNCISLATSLFGGVVFEEYFINKKKINMANLSILGTGTILSIFGSSLCNYYIEKQYNKEIKKLQKKSINKFITDLKTIYKDQKDDDLIKTVNDVMACRAILMAFAHRSKFPDEYKSTITTTEELQNNCDKEKDKQLIGNIEILKFLGYSYEF